MAAQFLALPLHDLVLENLVLDDLVGGLLGAGEGEGVCLLAVRGL